MAHDRRDVLTLGAVALAASAMPGIATAQETPPPRYGLIGQMLAKPGKRAELVGCLKNAIGGIPGCLSYIVALDTANPDAIWVTEVWDSRESHAASLKLPVVRATITQAKPIIAGFRQHFETVPVAGL